MSHQGILTTEDSPAEIHTLMEVAQGTLTLSQGRLPREVDSNVIVWLSECPLWSAWSLDPGCVSLGNCVTTFYLKNLICKMEVTMLLTGS